jgi:intracellular sulfur oxidation DsrE/DsrF family protein
MRDSPISRRQFVGDVGYMASAVPLLGSSAYLSTEAAITEHSQPAAADWDLSWIQRLGTATDRAVFDWPSLGSADDAIVLQIAARYLDNCAVAYAAGAYKAVAVLNIRTTAIPAAMTDSAWGRYALGTEYKLVDPTTKADAVRNPFWSRPPQAPKTPGTPTIEELVQRDAIILVCDFAMGHLAARLATKANQSADEVHQVLLHSLVPGAYAVPSGIFGLARSQNAGCAFIRM